MSKKMLSFDEFIAIALSEQKKSVKKLIATGQELDKWDIDLGELESRMYGYIEALEYVEGLLASYRLARNKVESAQ